MSRAEAISSVISGQEGSHKWFGLPLWKGDPTMKFAGRVMVYVSCINVMINSSVSSHPSKPLGMDDKLYSH